MAHSREVLQSIATADYDPDGAGYLGLRTGDIVTHTLPPRGEETHGWAYGTANGKEGWFPPKYVRPYLGSADNGAFHRNAVVPDSTGPAIALPQKTNGDPSLAVNPVAERPPCKRWRCLFVAHPRLDMEGYCCKKCRDSHCDNVQHGKSGPQMIFLVFKGTDFISYHSCILQ